MHGLQGFDVQVQRAPGFVLGVDVDVVDHVFVEIGFELLVLAAVVGGIAVELEEVVRDFVAQVVA